VAVVGAAQRVGAGGGEVGRIAGRTQCTPDEGPDSRLVVDDEDLRNNRVRWLGDGGLNRFLRRFRSFAACGSLLVLNRSRPGIVGQAVRPTRKRRPLDRDPR